MHGYLGHTVKLVNKKGEWGLLLIQHDFPIMHQIPHPGTSCRKVCRLFPKKDLYNAIESGVYPKWSLEVQTMSAKEAEELWEKQKINVFDLSHVWPHEQFLSEK